LLKKFKDKQTKGIALFEKSMSFRYSFTYKNGIFME